MIAHDQEVSHQHREAKWQSAVKKGNASRCWRPIAISRALCKEQRHLAASSPGNCVSEFLLDLVKEVEGTARTGGVLPC